MLSWQGDKGGPNGDERRNGCVSTVNAIKSSGGAAKFLLLPEAGHKGDSHMLMLDRINIQIADLVIGWIDNTIK